MTVDAARIVLSAIIPNRRDLLAYAIQHLEPEHFRESTSRNIFKFLCRYYDKTSDVMPEKFLSSIMESIPDSDTGKTLLYEELYRQFSEEIPADHEFRYAITALKDERSLQLTGEAITSAFQVLQQGLTVGKADLKGHRDARQYLYGELGRIDKLNNAEQAPEGFLEHEKDNALQDYAERKAGKELGQGIETGIGVIDRASGGFQPGEMILVCAYTSEGKSMLSTQTAWHACYVQNKNVFFATSETIRPQVMRRIYARHSRLPKFNFPEGLNSAKIKNGNLSSAEEKVYTEVVEDIAETKTYGKMYIAQIPPRATLGFLEARLNRQGQEWNVDLVVVDYWALLKPDQKRQNQREELNDILKDGKSMAVGHADGRGVPIVSPWAMSQSAYKEALHSGLYTLANLAETSEAEKSQPLTSKVLTPDRGWILMGDLKVGDRIVDPQGEDSKIVEIFPQGLKDVYRLTFDDGDLCDSSPGHLWKVRTTQNCNYPPQWFVLSSAEIRNRLERKWKLCVPTPDEVVLDSTGPKLIDPYVLGLLLGDGSFTGNSAIKFGSADPQLIEELRQRLPRELQLNLSLRRGDYAKYRITSVLGRGYSNPYVRELTRLNLMGLTSQLKFVPDEYKMSDPLTRLEVLRGLMDTDGNSTYKDLSFGSSSLQLREDVIWLARSLGCKAARGQQETFYYDSNREKVPCKPSYKARILPPQSLEIFRLARKTGVRRNPEEVSPVRYIKSVEVLPPVPQQCIRVSAASSLYITDGVTVTHNSADQIWSLLRLGQKDEVKMQCLKLRDGDPPATFSLETAYHCAYLGEKPEMTTNLLNGDGFGSSILSYGTDPYSSL